MKKILFYLLIIIISYPAFAQLKLNVKVNATNLFRYGNGKENNLVGDNSKEYLEEIGDVRLFVNDFIFGVRYEYDSPIEFGRNQKGIVKRFIEFNKDGFNVRAGNSYELFEKGLVINTFENRGLGFNTQLDGIRVNYKNTFKNNLKFSGTIIAGDIEYSDYLDTSRVEKYKVRGGNFSFSPLKNLTLGGSYLFSKGSIPTGSFITNINSEIFESSLGFNYKSISLFGSYANKVTISEPNSVTTQSKAPRGDGGYASLSFTRPGFGLTVDYKNYRFNVVKPNERSSTNAFKPLPFQVPPSCDKEHTSTLLSRYPHNVDFGDEVGFQLDAFYTPKENLNFNLNASFSSRHYDYYDADTSLGIKYERIERNNSFLPSLKESFSPYWEVYVEGEWYVKKNLKVKIAASRQYSVLYIIENPSSSDIIKTFTVPLELKYDFKKIWSIKFNSEQQWVYNSIRNADQLNFYNQYISVAISKSPNIVCTGNIEFTNDKEDASGKKFWGSTEVTYKFSNSNQASLSYGSERGGLKCSSGICRYVKPFNGFRFTIINTFN